MNWKDFFKPTIIKIILAVLLTLIARFFIIAPLNISIFLSPVFVVFFIFSEHFALGNIYLILGLQFIFDYFLSCSIVGFLKSIKNRGYFLISLITLIFLIFVVVVPVIVQAQIHKHESFLFLTNRGFVPFLDTREKCISGGFEWLDPTGAGAIENCVSCCHNNLTKEQCLSRGYYWNPCAFTTTETRQTAEGFIHNQVCVEKCIIKK